MLIWQDPEERRGGDGDGSDQVESARGLWWVILVGEATSASSSGGWFQFLCIQDPPHSTNFLTFHCFGLSYQSVYNSPIIPG